MGSQCVGQSWAMWAAIENGAEFYLSEDDYISADEFKEDSWESPRGMLVNTPVPRLIVPADASEFLRSGSKRRKVPIVVAHESSQAKRPRRSVTSPPKSYAETEASSEEDADLDSEMEIIRDVIKVVKETQKAIETSLQLWIKHLKLLQKEEQLKASHILCHNHDFR